MTFTPYTDVKICDGALILLGEGGINSIENPKTDVEGACATLYPLALATLLSKHDWNFANPLRKLAADSNATEDDKAGYKYAYRLPSNMLAGPSVVYADNDLKTPFHDFQISGDFLLADTEIIHIKFRARPDVSIMPEYFIDLFCTDLAMRLAKPVADNTALMQELRIRAYGPADLDGDGGMFKDAKKLDSMAQPMRSLFDNGDPLTETRY